MTCMHDKEVNSISELNLLLDILNSPKLTKHLNSHYYPIIYGYMNTRKGKSKFKKFRILLDSGCSSTIVMGRLVEKLGLKIDAMIKWHTQYVNIIMDIRVEVDFT